MLENQPGTYPFRTSLPPPTGRKARNAGKRRPIDVFVGEKLLARRIALCLSQDDLATAVRMSPGSIAAYERGEERIAPADLLQFSELLGVNLGFFFQEA